ncbi:indolepyruvate ferredoxin oxidoreductase family protein [Ilumatobacter coccineus]|uniref:Putative oxidoreductase n=1 Tax=Ilumatobacter coccineus (strain NBRC 103263 / KCTC 29153 / YM16-304) TaxID=1313172 RepID=A0A6C7EB06_ILUCY|nr:indolepyruvate ferredoxin oxidoreductase family protein [Ilumatobacter coccineus]BAN03661.1 putative oxidoreductase [Ilumatobacter coccineus YM16-304]
MTTIDRPDTHTSSTDSEYQLSDRYLADEGRVFMTGVQALSRLPIEQLRADRADGLNTAAFASGYPGSPLGGIDGDFARAAAARPELPFVVRPSVNEELAATAVMGTQLVEAQPDAKYDGVLGLWYGKAQGLDRSCDALRHGVFGGTSRHGGAVVLVGDDPGAKSSVVPSSSDLALLDLHLPVFYPADVQDALDLGRHAIAMSRATGLWTAMKIVAPVADGSGTVDVRTYRTDIVIPDMHIEGAAEFHVPDMRLLPPHNMDIELDIRTTRMERAQRYLAANQLNRVVVDPGPSAWIGLAATGHTFSELRESLRRLGLVTDDDISNAGIRLYQIRVPLPFDIATTRRFAEGLEELVVVEEKDPTLELYLKDALYGTTNPPLVVGKRDERGDSLMPNHGPLYADTITPQLRKRLERRIGDRLAPPPPAQRDRVLIPLTVERAPYFCSGCPHNWGTKVPDGDVLVGAGVGCHTMALTMDEDKVGNMAGITQMGGEGAQWTGMSPFVDREHFIQNLGDGTFFHSGQLAVQAAIAAGDTITYKLLYNGTVAMTGGQDAVGDLDVPTIAGILIGHGVKRVIITTDDLDDYKGVELPRDSAGTVEVWNRERIVEAQEVLAKVPGVTVLIHDQACAAQARRLRKRDRITTPTQRVVINHRICEACGDCGEVSNCLSVQTIDTPLGVKTTIDQTTCNLDFSCLDGDCPSFMTVEADPDAPPVEVGRLTPPTDLPAPTLRVPSDHLDLRIAGIGGTGVVTAAQVISTAAMLDGFDARGLDQTGLSQKAGPVTSDIRLRLADAPTSNLLGASTADVLLAFDLLASVTDRTLVACRADHTVAVGSTTSTPTGAMVGKPELRVDELATQRARLDTATDPDATRLADAGALMERLLGNATTANTFVIGMAVQHGVLPISSESIEQAIRLNGVHVEANIDAFRWGRAWIVDPDSVETPAASRAGLAPIVEVPPLPSRLAKRVSALTDDADQEAELHMLTADLVGYQHAKYAATFLSELERVATTAPSLVPVVARSLHKLMAYKDEYEVARLLIASESTAAAEAVGGAGATVTWRLHPPMLKALGRDSKLGIPAKVGRPLMTALAKGKRLRGTKLDPFGATEMRRTERALVDEYRSLVHEEMHWLAGRDDDPDALAASTAALSLPMSIRGYEALKLRRVEEYRAAVEARRAAR